MKEKRGLEKQGAWCYLKNPNGGQTAMWVTDSHREDFRNFKLKNKHNRKKFPYGLGDDLYSWYKWLEEPGNIQICFNINKLDEAVPLFSEKLIRGVRNDDKNKIEKRKRV